MEDACLVGKFLLWSALLFFGAVIILITYPIWYVPYVIYRKVKYGYV